MKEAGIDVVYIKSSEGSGFIDPKFERNYEEAKKNGLKIGFYHYVNARTEEEAIKEAEFQPYLENLWIANWQWILKALGIFRRQK